MSLPKIFKNIDEKVNRSGDIMEGSLSLKGAPLSDNEASTKKYVDDSATLKTEASSYISGSSPEIDAVILNTINEKTNPL